MMMMFIESIEGMHLSKNSTKTSSLLNLIQWSFSVMTSFFKNSFSSIENKRKRKLILQSSRYFRHKKQTKENLKCTLCATNVSCGFRQCVCNLEDLNISMHLQENITPAQHLEREHKDLYLTMLLYFGFFI